jgi:hypothetical protein
MTHDVGCPSHANVALLLSGTASLRARICTSLPTEASRGPPEPGT